MKKSDNIILIGYRGTGKSVVAEELARTTRRRLISLDAEIEKKYGPISKIVEKSGWNRFREIETEMLKSITIESGIIDCGGGIIETPENIQLLNKKGKVFWLRASLNTIHNRLIGKTDRPALTENGDYLKEIEEVLSRRNPLYNNIADSKINTDGKSPLEIAHEVLGMSRKTQICIPIIEKREKDVVEAIKSANKKADIIELRIDYMDHVDSDSLGRMIDIADKPVIVTCRLKNQGGTGNISEDNRQDLLNTALKKEVNYIDLEFTSGTTISGNSITKIIRSHHNFKNTPELLELKNILASMKTKSDGITKYVSTANSINDNFKIFTLLEEFDNLISFCMGLKGHISRVLAAKYGSNITFAAGSKNKQSAPGQLAYDELVDLYNFRDIDFATEVFGIIGQFAENSKSKNMHNPVFKKYGINALFLPFKIESGNELDEFMMNFRKFCFSGSAITIPFKETVMQFLDDIDETAKAIGAVNTIKHEKGKLLGFNTDCIGAIKALQQKVSLKHKKVLVFGAGGAARAIVYGLKLKAADVTIVNRTHAKAQSLAREFEVDAVEKNYLDFNDFDIFINTTSVGMYPNVDSSIMDFFPGNRIVMDIVYKPLKTKFLQIAEKCECEIITGEKMLVWQAIAQQKIWTGLEPDYDFMSQCFFNKYE